MTIEYDRLGLKVSPADDTGRRWLLLAPFVTRIVHDGDEYKIVVPAGFISDFASVPRPLWSLIPPTGRYLWAAVVHDYFYFLGKASGRTRKESDQLFYRMILHAGSKKRTARVMYAGVRVGGFNRGNW